MGNVIEKLVRHKFAWLLCVLACAAYQIFFIDRAHVDLTINVEKRTVFKIYWADAGRTFSEKNMAQVIVKPERKNYSFFLTDLRDIKLLRIDPQEYIGTSSIEKISIKQNGSKEILLDSTEAFSLLKPLAQIAGHSVVDNILKTSSSGKDANFSYEVNLETEEYDWNNVIFGYLVICSGILLVYFPLSQLGYAFRYIPVMLTAVLTLALTMALISERNVHPDEYVHIAAAKYYKDQWLPPVIGDPKVADTYSVYGVSRLNTNEISYLFCGKFTKLIEPLRLTEHIPYRLFNISLLVLILLYTLRVPDARPVALPLILSPQIWYLFSYCNSDAFAITAAFFVGCQVVVTESSFNQFVSGRGGGKRLWYVMTAAFLFGVLFLLKANFLVYTAFLFWVFLLRVWQTTGSEYRKLLIQRFITVCCIGLSLLAIKKAADFQVNGLDRSQKIAEMRSKLALPLYNPDTPLEKQHNQLYMKQRGIPLAEIVHKDRWLEKTFRSMFGVYGYSTISGGFGYYDLVRWTGIAFCIFFFSSILIRSGAVNRLQVLAALSLAAALIAVSLYHSWTKDFQAQGRYLIPLLPILGVLCAQGRQYVNAGMLTIFTTCMYSLSMYSFICIALLEIPRLLRI
jgi:hypothetical protein